MSPQGATGSLAICGRCGGLKPEASFCPHCDRGGVAFRSWLRAALGAAALGTASACCANPVVEVEPVSDAGPDAGIDAGTDAGADAGSPVDLCDAGPIFAAYGAFGFPDGGCR